MGQYRSLLGSWPMRISWWISHFFCKTWKPLLSISTPFSLAFILQIYLCVCVCVSVCYLSTKLGLSHLHLIWSAFIAHWDECWSLLYTFSPMLWHLICINNAFLPPEQSSAHFYLCFSKEFTEYTNLWTLALIH